MISVPTMAQGNRTATRRLLVAAASDLRFALDSLIVVFNKEHEGRIDVTYGSSGKLTEQILNGAPFDIFFSADLSYPEILREKNKTASEIFPYAKGHLVLWSKRMDPSVDGIKMLTNPSVRKIAIANPQHAPYGKRAVECLEFYKLTESTRGKIVLGDNVSQTAQFVSTGAADVGIIALSLALSPNMKREKGKYFVIPQESYSPLVQGMVITSKGKGNSLAGEFFNYIKTDSAAVVLEHFGFLRNF